MPPSRILVIDDEPIDREMMREALRSEGFAVLEGANYDEGTDLFRGHEREIVLAVIDVSLPGRNGCELAKTILQIRPGTKILFISGHVGAEVIRFYGIKGTSRNFLRKPFSPEELVERAKVAMASPGTVEFTNSAA